jgi:hypothetical protein
MERIVFKSLANPNYRYTWHKSGYNSPVSDYRNRSSRIGDNSGWFDTYGDGDCQHSAESPVGLDLACDYLASLLKLLAETSDATVRDEMLECLENDWPKLYMARSEFTFALSVKHKPGKRMYYSKQERKISSAESKRYDKRWDEVTEYQDGSPKSAYAILNAGSGDKLRGYAIALELANVYAEENNHHIAWKDTAQMCGIVGMESDGDYKAGNKYREMANNLRTAFNGIDLLVKSWRNLDTAKRSWECLDNNYCRNVLGIGREVETQADTATVEESAAVTSAA